MGATKGDTAAGLDHYRADMNPDEAAFHKAMLRIYEVAKREVGYNATRFLQMLSEHGGVATAKQLLHSPAVSDGFTALWMAGRDDLTVEAHVVKPEFAHLFTSEELAIAERRLDQYKSGP